eukprot:4119182-Pleurochrysis_carterae.AAC.2
MHNVQDVVTLKRPLRKCLGRCAGKGAERSHYGQREGTSHGNARKAFLTMIERGACTCPACEEKSDEQDRVGDLESSQLQNARVLKLDFGKGRENISKTQTLLQIVLYVLRRKTIQTKMSERRLLPRICHRSQLGGVQGGFPTSLKGRRRGGKLGD